MDVFIANLRRHKGTCAPPLRIALNVSRGRPLTPLERASPGYMSDTRGAPETRDSCTSVVVSFRADDLCLPIH